VNKLTIIIDMSEIYKFQAFKDVFFLRRNRIKKFAGPVDKL